MARAKGSTRRGLNIQSDPRAERRLVAYYRRIDRTALAAAKRLLPSAAENGEAAIAVAILKIQEEVDAEFTDDAVGAAALKAADKQNRRHENLFFAGLGAAIGIPIVGGDSLTRPRAPVASVKRRKSVLIPKPNAGPQLATEAFVSQNQFYIGRVREGISLGLDDAIRNEGKLLGRALSSDDMSGLVSQWSQGGVPSWIPQNRSRRDGEKILISVKNHTDMIAVDQIETHNKELSLSRQTSAGIAEFVWETQQDNAVREKHRHWQSRVFPWSRGAPGGVYPGEEPRCRCWARAVVQKESVLRFGEFTHVDLSGEIPSRPLPFARQQLGSDPRLFTPEGRLKQ